MATSNKKPKRSRIPRKPDGKIDWAKYNDQLVRRGMALFDFEWLDKHALLIRRKNKNKVGSPFQYSDEFMKFFGMLKVVFHLPLREVEGFIRGISTYLKTLGTPDHATIHRRINSLDLSYLDEQLLNSAEPIELAVDSTGIKVSNYGDWMRKVHGGKKRRGWLKIHFAVDTKTHKIIAMDVTTEKVADDKCFLNLVHQSIEKTSVGRVLADGAYDTYRNFDILNDVGIDPAIKVDKNSKTGYTPRGISQTRFSRDKTVEEYFRDQELWKKKHNYGFRWLAESTFSLFKRTFGEHSYSKKFNYMVKEMQMKVFALNFLINASRG